MVTWSMMWPSASRGGNFCWRGGRTMAHAFTLCIGAVGGGLSCSPDGGVTWNRVRQPIPSECNVRALTVYPDNPPRILAGTDVGLFRSENAGGTWEKLESPMDGIQ